MDTTIIVPLVLKLVVAVVLGGALGLERTLIGRAAGLKTYSLVSLGSALFVIISLRMGEIFAILPGFNPIMMASQIIVGVGFLGAGSVIFQQHRIQGLTTAAGLWLAAAIGSAVGFGLYMEALLATVLALIVFTLFWNVEEKVKETYGADDK